MTPEKIKKQIFELYKHIILPKIDLLRNELEGNESKQIMIISKSFDSSSLVKVYTSDRIDTNDIFGYIHNVKHIDELKNYQMFYGIQSGNLRITDNGFPSVIIPVQNGWIYEKGTTDFFIEKELIIETHQILSLSNEIFEEKLASSKQNEQETLEHITVLNQNKIPEYMKTRFEERKLYTYLLEVSSTVFRPNLKN